MRIDVGSCELAGIGETESWRVGMLLFRGREYIIFPIFGVRPTISSYQFSVGSPSLYPSEKEKFNENYAATDVNMCSALFALGLAVSQAKAYDQTRLEVIRC